VGHQSALAAGLALARGDAVVTMDGDLQHPPEDLPRMVAAFEQGADVVQMVRAMPAAGGKGWLSRAFYRFFARVAQAEIVPDGSDFRLLSARVVDVLNRIPEREKFYRALIPSLGFRQVVLAYQEGDRLAGTPSYGFWKSLRLAQKALFDFSTLPLRAVFWFGTTLAATSFLFGLGHVVVKLVAWQRIVPGFTDLITAVLFLSGCILAALGVLGRYMILILDQVRGRPPYVVAQHRPGEALPPPAERGTPLR
jgi:glycosyltransferase involved in cell wall biosynthesis